VSTTPAANFSTSFANVVDTGGKFATGINDTSSKFATGGSLQKRKEKFCLIKHFFHLPPVLLSPVVHLELRISLRFAKKLETVLML
jgi:hypothetical protein